ncbi:hypothetical protein C1645_820407 [Glomus cerebriforme]|uniref:Uncharacterized protein n=1 Tax=Glomus cerebriforme TaxID=658196 RepID=A0A397T6Z8_9GLOM|nr:hypothetical protein C1645_820407 [Glomus cerebriforme]
MAHEECLPINICQRFRLRFNIKIPQLIEDITVQCVVAETNCKNIYMKFNQWKYKDYMKRLKNNLPANDEEEYSGN